MQSVAKAGVQYAKAHPGYVDDLVRDSEVWESNLPLWQAFHLLGRGRQEVGGLEAGYQPLAYGTLRSYAEDFGFDGTPDLLHEFLHCLYAMDGVFLTYHAEQAKKRAAKPKGRTHG